MSARRNDGGQANKNTPARTGPIIEGEIPFEFPRPDIQHNPRGCGCLSRGLRTRASRRRISLAEQDADHTVSTPALLGDVEIAAPIFMPQARGQELQCRVGQVLHAVTRVRNARDEDQRRYLNRKQIEYRYKLVTHWKHSGIRLASCSASRVRWAAAPFCLGCVYAYHTSTRSCLLRCHHS